MGTVLSTVAGNPCSVLSPVSSVTLRYCAVMRLTLREWLGALTGRDALSGKLVEAEATRSLPSQPWANQRIGNPSEALWGGASASRRIVAARASGESENRLRPYVRPLALI